MNAAKAPSLASIARKLHAAELQHLRAVVVEQHDLIESLLQRVEQLEGELHSAEIRADMFCSLANELRDEQPNVTIGLSRGGHLGVVA